MYQLQQFLDDVKQDIQAYYTDPWYKESGFWVVFSYRLRRYRKHGPNLAKLLYPVDMVVGGFRRIASDTRIPADTNIGPGLCLIHSRGIRISSKAVIGSWVRIYHQVTIGEYHGVAPVIGDCCAIYSGARLIGGLRLGKNVKVGPNVVLYHDVPANSTVQSIAPSILTT